MLLLGILDRNPDLYIVWILLVVLYITIFLKINRHSNLQTVARDVVLIQVEQGIVNSRYTAESFLHRVSALG